MEPLLAEARKRLTEIVATSARASEEIRRQAGVGDQAAGKGDATPTPARDLMGALVERIDAMREEALRLAVLLDRTEGRLTGGADREAGPKPARDRTPGVRAKRPAGNRHEDGPVPMRKVRALVARMAGAGASRQEIAAWVFREHGVVVSDRMVEEVVRAQRRSG